MREYLLTKITFELSVRVMIDRKCVFLGGGAFILAVVHNLQGMICPVFGALN